MPRIEPTSTEGLRMIRFKYGGMGPGRVSSAFAFEPSCPCFANQKRRRHVCQKNRSGWLARTFRPSRVMLGSLNCFATLSLSLNKIRISMCPIYVELYIITYYVQTHGPDLVEYACHLLTWAGEHQTDFFCNIQLLFGIIIISLGFSNLK